MSINRGIDEEDVYTMEYYSAIKKNEIMPFAVTWMDLEIIILSEESQTKKDKYHMIFVFLQDSIFLYKGHFASERDLAFKFWSYSGSLVPWEG